ncbi:MAG: hypothetical protein JNK79_07770 [Chitinophagaceae bacterium]|nr:hypothetical protein [Chitinophagaceae bacterium]
MSIRVKKANELQCLQLTELKKLFFSAIRKGTSFRELKHLYQRIRGLKRYLNSPGFNVE